MLLKIFCTEDVRQSHLDDLETWRHNVHISAVVCILGCIYGPWVASVLAQIIMIYVVSFIIDSTLILLYKIFLARVNILTFMDKIEIFLSIFMCSQNGKIFLIETYS